MTTLDAIRPLAKQYRRLSECGIMPINPSFKNARNWLDDETGYCYDLRALNDATYALLDELKRLHLRDINPWAEVVAAVVSILGLTAVAVCLLAIL